MNLVLGITIILLLAHSSASHVPTTTSASTTTTTRITTTKPPKPVKPDESQFSILPFPFPSNPRPPPGAVPFVKPKPIHATLPFTQQDATTLKPSSPGPHRPHWAHHKPPSIEGARVVILPAQQSMGNTRFFPGTTTTNTGNASLGVTTLFGGLFG